MLAAEFHREGWAGDGNHTVHISRGAPSAQTPHQWGSAALKTAWIWERELRMWKPANIHHLPPFWLCVTGVKSSFFWWPWYLYERGTTHPLLPPWFSPMGRSPWVARGFSVSRTSVYPKYLHLLLVYKSTVSHVRAHVRPGNHTVGTHTQTQSRADQQIFWPTDAAGVLASLFDPTTCNLLSTEGFLNLRKGFYLLLQTCDEQEGGPGTPGALIRACFWAG